MAKIAASNGATISGWPYGYCRDYYAAGRTVTANFAVTSAWGPIRTTLDNNDTLTLGCNYSSSDPIAVRQYIPGGMGCPMYTLCTTTISFPPTGTQDATLSSVVLAVGKDHTCSTDAGGTTKCWGEMLGLNRARWTVQ